LSVIGITIGDPFGIGPEITEKSVLDFSKNQKSKSKIVILGSKKYLKNIDFPVIDSEKDIRKIEKVAIFDTFPSEDGEIGKPSSSGGRISFLYLEKALQFAKSGILNSIITGPVSKIAWEMAGINYKGHTDFLKDYFGVERVAMTFWSEDIKIALFTHHIPLKNLWERLKREELESFLEFLFGELKRLNLDLEVLVAGLNPHAGEEGTIGKEEEEIIKPVIEKMKGIGFKISGPYPSDSLFHRIKGRRDVIVLCFYHDQGLIPFKLVHFKDGIHMTLGLPILRLSPVHGTAFDIAGKGIADPSSMLQCLYWLEKFSEKF
jgi:4-hydroxythreonine-4-phosphate dehydrogenase